MTAATDRLRVTVATPIPPHVADRIEQADPRVEVLWEPRLLPPMRHPGDHSGDPAFHRSERDQRRFDVLLGSGDVAYGIPGESPTELRRMVQLSRRLRWVQTMAAGGGAQVAAANLSAADLRRVVFTTAAGVHGPALAEFALLGILMGAKDVPRRRADQAAHHWPTRAPVRTLDRSTVLVLGLGGIGGEVARRCRALGMRVIGARRAPQPTPDVDMVVGIDELDRVAGLANHLVVTLPGTPSTQCLVDRRLLRALRPGATVVNVGRGSVVDEAALLDALDDWQVGFAALDVFATEPLPRSSRLWDHPRVLVSPHTAALDDREDDRIADLFCDNVVRHLNDMPLRNVVDPNAGY